MLSAAAYLARMQIQLLFLSARNDELNARSAFVYPPVEISCAFENWYLFYYAALGAIHI
jgi:hypothetical protein